MNEWMNELMNEWMNEWMNELMNEWMNEYSLICIIKNRSNNNLNKSFIR